MANPTHGLYRADIDGLRALAVMIVVGFHSFPGWFKGGFVGVDVFFVISGFLISGVVFEGLWSGRFRYVEFYSRRIRRIFPALTIVLACTLVFGWANMWPLEFAKLGKHLFGGAAFISNFLLWGEAGYFDFPSEQKPLLHLWSLGIEEQFYLFWPLLLGLAAMRLGSFLALAIAIALVSFSINVLTVSSNSVAAFYSPAARMWELMIGGILAYTTFRRSAQLPPSLRYQHWTSLAGLSLIVVSVVVLNKTSVFPGWWALLPTVGAVLLIYAGPGAWVNKNILSRRVVVSVGLISYPLYLWHWPALFVVDSLHLESPVQIRLSRLAAIAASVVLAYLTYWCMERPIRTRGGSRTTILLAGALALVGLAGAIVFAADGLSYKFPQLFKNVGDAQIQALQVEWRNEECFLQPGQTAFAPKCLERGRPLIILWGDSHAAALTPGLLDLMRQLHVGLGQYTASSCPPLLNWESPRGKHCSIVNRETLRVVNLEKPDVVVLHANWALAEYDLERLAVTVQELRLAGVNSIYLIGPVPQWRDGLPKALWKCYGAKELSVPNYSFCGLDPAIPILDLQMRQIAQRLGIKYISAYGKLCGIDGCLVRIGDSMSAPDYSHLSSDASRFLIGKIGGSLFSSNNDRKR